MFRSPSLLSVTLALAGSLPAQDPQERIEQALLPQVEELLDSDQPGQVAWGAFLAGKYRLRDAGGKILRELNEWDGDSDEHRVVSLHLLDGLLRVGRLAPPAVLGRLLDDPLTRDAAFAVMAQDPAAYAMDLLRIAKEPAPTWDLARKGAGQLLISSKHNVRELMLYALEEMEVVLRVVVRDGDDSNQWNSAIGLGGARKVRLKTMLGFPPLLKLFLTTRGEVGRGDRLVVPAVGSLPAILLGREEGVVYRPYELQWSAKEQRPSRWLAMAWMNAAARLEVDGFPAVSVDWTDGEAFEAVCRSRFDAVRGELDDLLEQLRKKRFLRKREAARGIPLKIEIYDGRNDKTVSLPDLEFAK